MAITTASIALPAEVSAEVISNVQDQSAVMQLARQIALPGRGAVVPVITADPQAYFPDEGDIKTNSDPTLSAKTMKARTISVIVPFSNQFRDSNDALYAEIVKRLPGVLGMAFDEKVFHGAAVSGFDTLANSTAISLATPWTGLVTAKSTIEAADGELTGFAMSNQMETALLGALDGDQRPLFIGGVQEGSVNRILGVDAVKAKNAYKDDTTDVLGFAGDWNKALYGIANGVNIAIADQATLTTSSGTVNLFERNMFAVRCEIEVGFVAAMANQFVKLTE